MKKKELTRPSQFLSNNLWELYTFISNLENSYIFSSDVPGKPGESLYYVEGMSLTELDTVYAHYSNGDLPEYKTEWLTLRLINAESGQVNKYTRELETDAWNERELPVEKVLEKYGLRIPKREELDKWFFYGAYPVGIHRLPYTKNF